MKPKCSTVLRLRPQLTSEGPLFSVKDADGGGAEWYCQSSERNKGLGVRSRVQPQHYQH